MMQIENVFKCTIGLRWFSMLNPEMDLVVFVRGSDRQKAGQAIRDGVNRFWDSNDECYGDCIEQELTDAGVPYIAEYEHNKAGGDDALWECRLNRYYDIGIEIYIVEE